MNAEIETAITKMSSLSSQLKGTKPREPLKMSDLPSGPWKNISADFCGPLENGDYLLVVVDEYSRYPIVEIVKSVSANMVIPVMDKIISMFGVPKVIKTDNGSPFNSTAFADFAKFTVLYTEKSRLGGQGLMLRQKHSQTVMKSVKSAFMEGRNYKQELFRFSSPVQSYTARVNWIYAISANVPKGTGNAYARH
ncbi:uncharacterized protein K02A2.6-like [Ruditapes philippinarum]|uniref:uncharacterized protein K02A2.6-like n=1 Tax=Ruditapes philippinarum TaxID=129788 RepID=UPI00295C0201|nr:uncharacterized protein K02A2.6-like [Ruditapes philippinarum]